MASTTYKSHPSKAQPEENLGPENIASSPEALLLAAVIRQAVEDVAESEESIIRAAAISYHSKKQAFRRRRRRIAAERFLFEELEDFLNHFDVSHLFHRDTIVRQVKKNTASGISDVAPHLVEPTKLSHSFRDACMGDGGHSLRFFDRVMPRQQYGLRS